jgi:A/G-specific adenine glycosylase
VWISEMMLQQTQVKTVLPYFQRFMKRFPDVHALAAAREEEVLASWSGLGYYRRVRAIHRAARWIVQENRGRFPDTYEDWLALPGVGRYSAGAILSIAFGRRHAILDGNVARVLSRVFLIQGDPRQAAVRKKLWQKSEEILPQSSVADFNQALMELGALVCTRRNPRCGICPIATECLARQNGLEMKLPEVPRRSVPVKVKLTAAVLRRKGGVLMYRRENKELMRGLWELPGGPCRGEEDPRAAAAREARERYGLEVETGREIARVKHSIMNRRITLYAFEARLKSGLGPRSSSRAWVDPDSSTRLPMSSMTLKVFRAMQEDKKHKPANDTDD